MRRYKQRRKTLSAGAIAARLRKIRKDFGCAQGEMAEMLGLTKDAYGKNERGEHLPQVESLAALHDRLGVSVEWLLFNRGPVYWKKGVKQEMSGEILFSTEAEEMVDLMKQIPFLRHAVMGFFQKFKIENKVLIREYLEKE